MAYCREENSIIQRSPKSTQNTFHLGDVKQKGIGQIDIRLLVSQNYFI